MPPRCPRMNGGGVEIHSRGGRGSEPTEVGSRVPRGTGLLWLDHLIDWLELIAEQAHGVETAIAAIARAPSRLTVPRWLAN